MAGDFCRFGDAELDATVPIKKRRIYLEAVRSPPVSPSLPLSDLLLVNRNPPGETPRNAECFSSSPTDGLDGSRASFEPPETLENYVRIGRSEMLGRMEIYVDGDPPDYKIWFETERFSSSMDDELDGNRASFETPELENEARIALYEMPDRTELSPDNKTPRKTECFSLPMDGLDRNRASFELPKLEISQIALNETRDRTETYADRDHPPDDKTPRKTECFSLPTDELDGNRASFEPLEPENDTQIAQHETQDRTGIYVDREHLNDKTLLKTEPPQCCSSPKEELDEYWASFEPPDSDNNPIMEKDKRDRMEIYVDGEHPYKFSLKTASSLKRVAEREESCSSLKDGLEKIRASFEPPDSENTRIVQNEKGDWTEIYVDREPPDKTLLKADPPLPKRVEREQWCSSSKGELEEDMASIEPPNLEYTSVEANVIAENGKQEQMESYIFGFGYGYDQIEVACESTVCNEKTSESNEVDYDEPSSRVDLVDFFASERRNEVRVGWIEDEDDDDDNVNELEEVEEYADYSEEEEEEVEEEDGGLAFDERQIMMPLLHRVESDNNNKRGIAMCPIREFGDLDSYGIREGSENGIEEREADAIPEAKSFDVDIMDGHGESGSLGRYLPRGNFSGRGYSKGRRFSSPSECASDLSLLSSRNGSRTLRMEEDGHARFASSRDFGCAKSFGRGVGLAGVVRFDHWIEGSARANRWSSNHNHSGFTSRGSRNAAMANDRSTSKAGMIQSDLRSSVMTRSRHGVRGMAPGGARRDPRPPSSSMDTSFPGRMVMVPRRGTERNLDRSGYLGSSFRMDSDIYQTYPPATQRLSSSASSRQDYNFLSPKRSWGSSNSPQQNSGSYTRSRKMGSPRWAYPRSNEGGDGGLVSDFPKKRGRYHGIVPKDNIERERILPHARRDVGNSSKSNSILSGSPSKWFNHPHRHQEVKKSQEQDLKHDGRRLSPHVVHGSALTDERDLQLLAAARHSSPPPSSRHKQIEQLHPRSRD